MSFQSDLTAKLKIEIGPSASGLLKKCLQELKKDPENITQSDIQEIAQWTYAQVRRITDEPTAIRVLNAVNSMKPNSTELKRPFSAPLVKQAGSPITQVQVSAEAVPELKDMMGKILEHIKNPGSKGSTGSARVPDKKPSNLMEKYNSPEMWCAYGDTCRKEGRYDDADEAYGRALELRPEYPEVFAKRANLRLEKEKPAIQPDLRNRLNKLAMDDGPAKSPATGPAPVANTSKPYASTQNPAGQPVTRQPTVQSPPVQQPVNKLPAVQPPPVQQPARQTTARQPPASEPVIKKPSGQPSTIPQPATRESTPRQSPGQQSLAMQLPARQIPLQQPPRQPTFEMFVAENRSLYGTKNSPMAKTDLPVLESGSRAGSSGETPDLYEDIPKTVPGTKPKTLNEKLEDCLSRLENDKSNGELWAEVADLYSRTGKFRECAEAYRHAVELGINSPEIWTMYGDASKKIGQYRDANDAYSHVLEIRPEDPEIWLKRAKVQASMNKYNDALVSCDKSIGFDGTQAQALHYKAFLLKKTRRNEEALDVLMQIRKLNPGDENAARQIVELRKQLKK